MDYRLDRVRIIKDDNNKVLIANRGYLVCCTLYSYQTFLILYQHCVHIHLLKNQKHEEVNIQID